MWLRLQLNAESLSLNTQDSKLNLQLHHSGRGPSRVLPLWFLTIWRIQLWFHASTDLWRNLPVPLPGLRCFCSLWCYQVDGSFKGRQEGWGWMGRPLDDVLRSHLGLTECQSESASSFYYVSTQLSSITLFCHLYFGGWGLTSFVPSSLSWAKLEILPIVVCTMLSSASRVRKAE